MRILATILITAFVAACQTAAVVVPMAESCAYPSLDYPGMVQRVASKDPTAQAMTGLSGDAAQTFMRGFNATPEPSEWEADEVRSFLLSNGVVLVLFLQGPECVRYTIQLSPKAFATMLDGRAYYSPVSSSSL